MTWVVLNRDGQVFYQAISLVDAMYMCPGQGGYRVMLILKELHEVGFTPSLN